MTVFPASSAPLRPHPTPHHPASIDRTDGKRLGCPPRRRPASRRGKTRVNPRVYPSDRDPQVCDDHDLRARLRNNLGGRATSAPLLTTIRPDGRPSSFYAGPNPVVYFQFRRHAIAQISAVTSPYGVDDLGSRALHYDRHVFVNRKWQPLKSEVEADQTFPREWLGSKVLHHMTRSKWLEEGCQDEAMWTFGRRWCERESAGGCERL